MKNLAIEWRHYDKAGATCDRCATTGAAVKKVISGLSAELEEKGFAVTFTETLLPEELMAQSNMLLFNGVPLEQLLENVAVNENSCSSCSCLTGTETSCRTVEYQGATYEEIPEELVIKAIQTVVASNIP